MSGLLNIAGQALAAALLFLNSSSVWLVLSFALAGLLHNILSPDRMQRMLGNRKVSSIWKAIASGLLLPICSCGVVPLSLGLYFSGAYLGPALAFMTACPIINPAAVLMAYGLLGPQLATCYLVTGLVSSFLIGLLGNVLAGPELRAPGMDIPVVQVTLDAVETIPLQARLWSGLQWGFADLGVQVSKYIVPGILLAGLITAAVPSSTIQRYLGNPGLVSIGGIALIGAVMYVCAVGHIPFIAAMVASGAAPGVAVTFLMTGAATNLPELISIYNLIGRRAAVIYNVGVVGISLISGWLTNRLLMPGFVPYFNLSRSRQVIGLAGSITLTSPELVRYLCSLVVLGLCLYALWPGLRRLAKRTQTALAVLLVLLLLMTGGCGRTAEKHAQLPPPPAENEGTPGETTPSPLVSYWQQRNPGSQLVKWADGDLNGDSRQDAVIIYRVGGNKCQLAAVLDLAEGIRVTEPLPAPVSDQVVSIGGAGNRGVNEVIVSGKKDGAYGYAIYALEQGRLVNVYGEGMDQCC